MSDQKGSTKGAFWKDIHQKAPKTVAELYLIMVMSELHIPLHIPESVCCPQIVCRHYVRGITFHKYM